MGEGEIRSAYKILVGKSEGNRSVERTGSGCENNIKMNLRETVCEGVDWIHLAQDKVQCFTLVNTVMNLQVL
jgi:hypothetical protein